LNAPDTSVAVAAALPWHEAHAAASAELGGAETVLLAHVAVETYSVLTRLPPPQRVPPTVALAYLRETFGQQPLALSSDGYARLVERAADESIAGGAVYDALVAATALEAGATLLTLDRRAVTTYRLLGAEYRLVA
jgi:predicted nucleic acid-binding protein